MSYDNDRSGNQYGGDSTGNTGFGDSDNSRGNYGSNTGTGTGNYGSNTGTGEYGSNTGTGTGNYGSNTSGPHDSNLANKLDPRVDSDRDGSNTVGGNRTGDYSSNTGTGNYGSDTSGPHRSNLANKADPRVDSDRDGSNTVGGNRTGDYGSNTGTGNYGSNTGNYGSNTSGPHDSNLANKADPRVDSDRDGSNTLGRTGNQSTGYDSGNTGYDSGNTGYGTGTGNQTGDYPGRSEGLGRDDDTSGKKGDSVAGKLMQKAGGLLHNENLERKGAEKRFDNN